jgi:hypothetical protein
LAKAGQVGLHLEEKEALRDEGKAMLPDHLDEFRFLGELDQFDLVEALILNDGQLERVQLAGLHQIALRHCNSPLVLCKLLHML